MLLLSPGERVVEDPTSIKAGRGERKRAVGTKPPLGRIIFDFRALG